MKYKILVIDDEEVICYLFEKILVNKGYKVFKAATYEEAFSELEKRSFDLVFTDIVLKDRTGLDVLRLINEKNINCPTVIVTGRPDIKNASEALRLGAFDYIIKPIENKTILNVTRLALKHKALVDEKEKYRRNIEAIFRNMNDGIITVDNNMVLQNINKAAMDICSLSPDDIGEKVDYSRNTCNAECLNALGKSMDLKTSIQVVRHNCSKEGRSNQTITLKASPLFDGKSNLSGGFVIIREETSLVKLEEDLGRRQHYHNIIGKSFVMQKVYKLIDKLSSVRTTVLIIGESGTGKELVAEALHYKGNRREFPLVKINCSALSENLLESELFGHVKGAFTGAEKDKIGRFETADRGTVFLDEIADISPRIQNRLLRVLQEKEFERVGDNKPIKVDIRIVAATNKDINEKVLLGEFRDDLFYRLKVVVINLPPLRERRDDIPLLLDHFIMKFNYDFDISVKSVSDDVLNLFMNHRWPGNIRQMEHVIEHAFIVCPGSVISIEDLPDDFKDSGAKLNKPVESRKDSDEAGKIIKALELSKWNKAKAARMLGINRTTLWRKMAKYNL